MSEGAILITGAAGFIGSALVKAFRERYRVFGVDRCEGETVSARWDLRDPLPDLLFPDAIDVLIHAGGLVGLNLAWPHDDYRRVNVDACAQLASYALASKAKHVIYFSTGGVYGLGANAWKEDDPVHPSDIYAESKWQGELTLQSLAERLPLTILRLFFPYGPGQTGRLMPNLIERIRQGQTVRLNNSEGSPRINPIYVKDVVDIVSTVIDHEFPGVLNVAGPDTISIRELGEILSMDLHVPVTFESGETPSLNLIGDISKLRGVFPGIHLTRLQQGLMNVLATFL